MKVLKIHSLENLQMCQFFIVLLFGIFISLNSFIINAQQKWNISVRSGANFSTNKTNDLKLKPGVGFEADLSFKFYRNVALYTGWGWNSFHTENSFAVNEYNFMGKGYRFGLQYTHPFKNSSYAYQLSLGGLYNHIELISQEGKILEESSNGFGWQTEAGIIIPVGLRFNLNPTLRYQVFSRNIKIGSVINAIDFNCLSTGLSIGWSF
jgi:hypothetical protein